MSEIRFLNEAWQSWGQPDNRLMLLLMLVAFMLHAQSLLVPLIWDDLELIRDNPHLRNPLALFTHPLFLGDSGN